MLNLCCKLSVGELGASRINDRNVATKESTPSSESKKLLRILKLNVKGFS
jgi:hypothetical protein